MGRTREEIMEERSRLRAEYPALYDSIGALLFRHDPIGINFETNTDEYEPEVGTILPRLKHCCSVDDVQMVVYEEFSHWFGASAGSPERYRNIAPDIWRLWNEYLRGHQ